MTRKIMDELPVQDGVLPDGAIPLYIPMKRVFAMVDAGIWPSPSLGGGHCVLNLSDNITYITPKHPEFKKMMDAFSNEEIRKEWEVERAAHNVMVDKLRLELESNWSIETRSADYGCLEKKIKKEIASTATVSSNKKGSLRVLDPHIKIVQLRPDPELWKQFEQKCALENITKRQGYTTALTNMVILKQKKYDNKYNKRISNLWPAKNIYLSIDLIISAGEYGWYMKKRNNIFNTALLNYCS